MPLSNIYSNGIKKFKNSSPNTPRKYISFGLKYGPRTLKSEVGLLIVRFTDDSPSKKVNTIGLQTEKKYIENAFQLDFSWGRYKGISSSLMFDIMLGKNDGGLFGYSIGWNFPVVAGERIFLIRPGLIGMAGNFGYSFGKLSGIAIPMQINSSVFNEEVEVSTSSQIIVYGPLTDFRFTITNNFHAVAQISYLFTSENKNVEINFKTKNVSEKHDTDQKNNFVDFNGNIVNSLPYDASGLRLSIGLAYSFNRY